MSGQISRIIKSGEGKRLLEIWEHSCFDEKKFEKFDFFILIEKFNLIWDNTSINTHLKLMRFRWSHAHINANLQHKNLEQEICKEFDWFNFHGCIVDAGIKESYLFIYLFKIL